MNNCINKLPCWNIEQKEYMCTSVHVSTSVGSDISYRVDPDQVALTRAA